MLISGTLVVDSSDLFATLCANSPHSLMMSFALHRNRTSPTKSDSEVVCGICHGELKVSASARCCSAITRREMRYNIPVSPRQLLLDTGLTNGTKHRIYEIVHHIWLH